MVFGVESLKKSGMQPDIGSSRLLAFEPFLIAEHSPIGQIRSGAV
jgi:hypothetical protein